MTVSTAGTGERSLFVSYVSEAPVWKTTYRIVLDGKAGRAPLLQGWAIVDNTGGQDWENVSLSLVAGAPQSFIQNLSQPYYTRRPVIGLPDSMNVAPQTYESTLTAGSSRLAGAVRDPSSAGIAGASGKPWMPPAMSSVKRRPMHRERISSNLCPMVQLGSRSNLRAFRKQ
jgi:hypothetical protein